MTSCRRSCACCSLVTPGSCALRLPQCRLNFRLVGDKGKGLGERGELGDEDARDSAVRRCFSVGVLGGMIDSVAKDRNLPTSALPYIYSILVLSRTDTQCVYNLVKNSCTGNREHRYLDAGAGGKKLRTNSLR